MITCHRSFLEARCRERGYTLAEVMACVVARDGDEWTIDENSPFYPHATHGAGSELKSLLAVAGITSGPDCKCNARATYMDRQGIDWCERNIEEIVGWLRETASERGLPFVDMAGRVLVRRAIANARRKESAYAQRSPHHDRREAMAAPIHQADG